MSPQLRAVGGERGRQGGARHHRQVQAVLRGGGSGVCQGRVQLARDYKRPAGLCHEKWERDFNRISFPDTFPPAAEH